jgi:quinol monooxygenase YgiN
MKPTPLQLIVEFRCKAGLLDEVEHRAVKLVQQTRAEPGCEEVFFYRVNEDSERFVLLAQFKDEDSLQEHLEASWRREALASVADMLAEPVRRFTMKRVA